MKWHERLAKWLEEATEPKPPPPPRPPILKWILYGGFQGSEAQIEDLSALCRKYGLTEMPPYWRGFEGSVRGFETLIKWHQEHESVRNDPRVSGEWYPGPEELPDVYGNWLHDTEDQVQMSQGMVYQYRPDDPDWEDPLDET